MITVENFKYEPSTPAYLQQGIKNHQVPCGAVGGGNGSFIMQGNPPQVILSINENDTMSAVDYYAFIKANSTRRMSSKYASEVCSPVVGQSFDNMRELAEALRKNIK